MTLILLLQLDMALIRYRSNIGISTGPVPAKHAGSDIGENVADNRIR